MSDLHFQFSGYMPSSEIVPHVLYPFPNLRGSYCPSLGLPASLGSQIYMLMLAADPKHLHQRMNGPSPFPEHSGTWYQGTPWSQHFLLRFL